MEDVHQIKSFLAVAEYLSFTRAAETLFLTQSAVSRQIKELEDELGVEPGPEVSALYKQLRRSGGG